MWVISRGREQASRSTSAGIQATNQASKEGAKRGKLAHKHLTIRWWKNDGIISDTTEKDNPHDIWIYYLFNSHGFHVMTLNF